MAIGVVGAAVSDVTDDTIPTTAGNGMATTDGDPGGITIVTVASASITDNETTDESDCLLARRRTELGTWTDEASRLPGFPFSSD